MLYERHSFCSRKSLRLDFMDLLFAPGSQLMHAANAPWTEVEKDAVIGLQLIRLFEDFLRYREKLSPVDQAFLVADEDSKSRALALFNKLGCEHIGRQLSCVYKYLQKIDAQAPDFTISEGDATVLYRLKQRVNNAQFDLKLAAHLDAHAAQLRGTDYSRQQFDFPPPVKAHPANPSGVVCDWEAGNCYQLVFDHLSQSTIDAWWALPGSVGFQEAGKRILDDRRNQRLGHLGHPKDSEILRLVDPHNLSVVGEQMLWAVVGLGYIFPRLLSNDFATFERLRAQAQSEGSSVLTQHLRLASHASDRNAFTCFENENIGQPALFAARLEGQMPWLIFDADGQEWWFLEASAEWECHAILGKHLLCKPKTEAAILSAFSHIGLDSNLCFGAVSGGFPAKRLAELLSDEWGAKNVLRRGTLAAWAYGHQWGGGADEHFSVFAAQGSNLAGEVAVQMAATGLEIGWL